MYRLQGSLAVAAAGCLGVVSTLSWVATLCVQAPEFLTSKDGGVFGSSFLPVLLVAMVVMIGTSWLVVTGRHDAYVAFEVCEGIQSHFNTAISKLPTFMNDHRPLAMTSVTGGNMIMERRRCEVVSLTLCTLCKGISSATLLATSKYFRTRR